ncbi:SusC/RagA family TonB-linked outer membrane protein [Adhaeribacter aerolatus]|uniref:SusC/RagA family TonB-linked outer membrane protein n=1 Tax=Adhaeribacter aerolatus TaxID=670289 RepID=A0A512AT07_9BACT|nr:TonB-dependent receptor [Adhaeribacter aerolatus]GEO02852.1 SusC/RagA family TonB-linked outer membrane protein [Adhaeribacter aerolatus]
MINFTLKHNFPAEIDLWKLFRLKHYFSFLLIALLVNMANFEAFGQATVAGRVVTNKNEALPGVTVLVKGTSTGTTTDPSGNYAITLPTGQENGALIFSFIGYTTQEVPVNNRTTINVTLVDDAQALQEVVVIGYQTVRKQDLTGAASVITPEAAQKVTANSIAESIQGLAPGVTVRNTGRPGAGAAVDIRGVASFTNTNPLYVIDGMIADASPTLNNDDIESIQILKDASAAAIYGSRAGNGVIIITTKKGKEGPARIGVSVKQGVQQLPKLWDVMNSEEFAATQRQQYINSGATPPASVALTPITGPGAVRHYTVTDTDWQDEITQLGTLSDYNLTLSGGGQAGNYLISGSYFTNEGVVTGNSFDRASVRINTQGTKGRITFGENLVLSHAWEERPLLVNPFYDMPQLLPVIPVRDPSLVGPGNPGGWGLGDPVTAPVYAWNYIAMTNLFNTTHKYSRAVGNAYADVKIFDWLTYRFNTGLDAGFDFHQNIRTLGNWVLGQAFEPTHIYQDRQEFHTVLLENTVNFNKTLGVHNLNGVVGYTQQRTRRDRMEARRNDLQSFGGQDLTTISSAIGDQTSEGRVMEDYHIYGTLGRINYTYNDRYLLTLTGRYDQDSRFGPDNRSKFFPSIALGWRLSQESFLKNYDWISDLKLRASYGQLGIATVGSWDYIGVINNNPRVVFGADNQTIAVGAYQASLTNPDLRWEIRTSRNIGLDGTFLNNRVLVTAEYYNSLSEDVLVRLPIPFYTGNLGGDPFVNAASIRNRGVEFSATYRSSDNPFKWDISANFTTIKNEVEDVGNRGEGINYLVAGNTRSQIGRGIGEWYVVKTNGIFQTEEEVLNHKNSAGQVIQPFSKPGDIRFVDLNDDGQINDDDRTFAGSPWPTLQTGAQFNAAYGGFNFNLQLIGVFGQTVYNDVRRILDSYVNTNFRRDINPWTPENRNTSDPRLGRNTDPGIDFNNRGASDRWLEKASYVRVRNVEIGYNLPATFLSRLHTNNARLFISGQNLLTFTDYSGLDPDVTGNGILERGVDAGSWPASRVYSIGLNFEF